MIQKNEKLDMIRQAVDLLRRRIELPRAVLFWASKRRLGWKKQSSKPYCDNRHFAAPFKLEQIPGAAKDQGVEESMHGCCG